MIHPLVDRGSGLAKVFPASGDGKYGIIFAHNMDNNPAYQNFYLFTIENNEYFALQKVRGSQVETVVSEPVKPGIIGTSGDLYLRVKAFNNFALLYANGELLKMVSIDEPVKGGIGLYAGPKIRVEFSQIKAAPAEH